MLGNGGTVQPERRFEREDQLKFARLSGDFNPMHMDAIAARRTQAGAPVVHGVHALLWLLDSLARDNPRLPRVGSMKVRFARMIYVGERVGFRVTQQDETTLLAQVLVEELPALSITANLGQPPKPLSLPEAAKQASFLAPTEAIDLSIDDMEGRSGKVSLPDESALAAMFPDAARHLGARRVAALACSSYLVGMVMPGLHSIYGGLTFDVCEDDADRYVVFQTSAVDSRFSLVRQNIWGGGVAASLDAFVRQPPVQQAALEEIAPHITPGEFARTTALIVGGSRGLGELTAKIIAAGGGKVLVTYARGKSDAETVVDEIRRQGGQADALAYDVLGDVAGQLEVLKETPSHVYYFATPPLVSRPSSAFSEKRYGEFFAFYVSGFERLIREFAGRHPAALRAFYPSSVAIDEQPPGMIEYAKAKASGEELCAKLTAELPSLRIVMSRLPRMLTDLTATIHPVETANPLTILLPLVRDVQHS